MVINKNTLLKDILASYPQLKDKLPEISPKFKMLSTPMGKIMLGKADIAMMSEKSGVDAEEIISGIKKLIGE